MIALSGTPGRAIFFIREKNVEKYFCKNATTFDRISRYLS